MRIGELIDRRVRGVTGLPEPAGTTEEERRYPEGFLEGALEDLARSLAEDEARVRDGRTARLQAVGDTYEE